MSSGRASRSSGDALGELVDLRLVFPFMNSSVATGPGATALTVISRPRSSLASVWTSDSTAALDALYAPYLGNDFATSLLEKAMIRPPRVMRRALSAITT